MKKPGAKLAISLVALVLLTSVGVVYAATAFNLTASSSVTVNPPTVAAVFVSGSISNEAVPGSTYVPPNAFKGESCTVGNGGLTLSCTSFSLQQGDYVTFIATVQNTGTITETANVQATPANPSVITIVPLPSNPSSLAPGEYGTFMFTLTAQGVGSAGFTVTVSGSAA